MLNRKMQKKVYKNYAEQKNAKKVYKKYAK